MKKYLIFIMFAFLLSCSSNTDYKPFVITKEHIPIKLPNWMINIPEGDFEIGISHKTSNESSNAKEFAAINYNRNIHSFVVDNKAVKKGEQIKDSSSFNINVSASIEDLHSIYDSMTLLDSVYVGNYFIGLFSTDKNADIKISNDMIKTFSIPNWYKPQKIYVENGKIYATVKYSSATMDGAVKIAMEKARIAIASYKTKHVLASTTSTDTKTSTDYAIETKMILGKVKTSNIYILKKKTDNALFSYEVYLRMWSKQ